VAFVTCFMFMCWWHIYEFLKRRCICILHVVSCTSRQIYFVFFTFIPGSLSVETEAFNQLPRILDSLYSSAKKSIMQFITYILPVLTLRNMRWMEQVSQMGEMRNA
jgi:hypothetical protein